MKRYVQEFANDQIKVLKEAMKIPANETTTKERREAHMLENIEKIIRCLDACEHGYITETEAMRGIIEVACGKT